MKDRSGSTFTSLCAVGLFARLSYSLARTPVLPLFALYLGAAPEAIGFAVGVSTVTGIFFKLPAGALSDIVGRRKTMLAGLVVFAVMPFSYLLVHDYRTLIAVRFVHGLATAIYGPVSMAVVADIAGARKGEMLSWFSSVTIIGNLIGAPVGGFILHSGPGAARPGMAVFHLVYIVSGLAGLTALVLALNILKDGPAIRYDGRLKEAFYRFAAGIKEVSSDARVVVTAGMEGLQNMAVGALEAFLPIYAVTVAGLDEFQAGMLWGIQVVSTMLSKPLMGWTSDRLGRKPLIAAGMLLCAFSFGAVPALTGFYTLMLAAIIFGLGEALVASSSAALVADICKERQFGTAMGVFGTIFDIGHAAGPILAGVLIARFGYLPSFLAMSAALVVSVPVFMAGVRLKPASAA